MCLADMLGHDLAGAVEAARLDLVFEHRHAGEGFVVLDCRAAGRNAGGRASDSGDVPKLLLDRPIVEHGEHAPDIQSGCLHALLLAFSLAQ